MNTLLLCVAAVSLIAVGTAAPGHANHRTTTIAPRNHATNVKHSKAPLPAKHETSNRKPDLHKVPESKPIPPSSNGKNKGDQALVASAVNIIDLPVIGCPAGQEIDRNGNCKDKWDRRRRSAEEDSSEESKSEDIHPVPVCIIGCDMPNRDCPEGQKPDINGNCRDDWG